MQIDKKTLRKIFGGAAGCIVLYWILHETERFKSVFAFLKGVLSPFILGAGLAFIINVPMSSIENRFVRIKRPGWRRTVALILTLLVLALVVALVFVLLIPQVSESAVLFYDSLLKFFNNAQKWIMQFLNDNPEIRAWVVENTSLETLNISAIIEKVVDMAGKSVTKILTGAVNAIGGIAGVVTNAVFGIIFSIYCLSSKENLARQGRKLAYAYLPETWADQVIRVLRLTNTTFSNFLSGQCVEVIILGAMFAVSMAIFRMPYIPLVSVLIAVTAFIPVVGAFVGCFFGTFFILVNDPIQAVGFVVMFLVLQQIENNVIYPRVVGDSVGLPSMWVLLAVVVGGELMGVAGMFLMIPMASVIYTLLREITNGRLEKRNVDAAKLIPEPMVHQSSWKAKGKSLLEKCKCTAKKLCRKKK